MDEAENRQNKDKLRKKLGKIAEKRAVKLLKRKGFRIIARNVESDYGEIDIIAKDADLIAFVEVRSKTAPFLVSPADSVNREKQRKIGLTAREFLRLHRISKLSYRFDIVSVIFDKEHKLKEIEHIESAFVP
ncbi:MAG: YraN family protein, partial [Planctomycetes bacterium]|nr:YraN family protein [Planctomycetota bacterium]